MKFENEYRYDNQIIKEAESAWWLNGMVHQYIQCSIIVVASVIWFIFEPSVVVASIGLLMMILIVACEWKRNQLVNSERERVHKQLGDDNTISVIVDKNVTIKSKTKESSVNFNEIDKIKKTKHAIVLICGNSTISLSKNGFKTGSCEDFMRYIKQVVRQEKKNKKIVRKKER